MGKIKRNSIVVCKGDPSGGHLRVAELGPVTTVIHLNTLMKSYYDLNDLVFLYQTELFEPGDTVRVREDYADRYSESEGYNDLTVVAQYENKYLTTRVEDNCGDEFTILNERLYLVKPAKGFKAGDRVVLDHDRVKKFDGEDTVAFYEGTGVLTLTEDSGSRRYKTTSHVRYGNGHTNNVPTRWLKLYEEPAKRVVGETIKAKDIKVGDKITATDTVFGLFRQYTGVVADISTSFGGSPILQTEDEGTFPFESRGAVYTLLEEAPEPVDENLQRLLDAEVGDIAHGTYADDYWKKVEADGWKMLDDRHIHDTETVFYELYGMRYGELHIYRKVEVAD